MTNLVRFSGCIVAVSLSSCASSTPPCSTAASAAATSAGAGAWSASSAARRRFVRITDSVQETLEDFPVLVMLDPQHVDYSAAAPGGRDLQFVDANGVTLAHEVEEWNPQGSSLVWVRIPKIAPGASDAGFWMYYANPAARAPEPKDVWASPYRAVWHFAGDAKDSTANHYDGKDVTAHFIPGRVGRAAALDSGAKEYAKLADDTAIVSGARGVTVSAWVQHRGKVRDNQDIIIGIGTASHEGHLSRVSVAVSPELGFVGEANPDEKKWQVNESPAGTSPNDEWHYFTVVIDVPGKSIKLYRDGAPLGTPLAGTWTSSAYPEAPSNRVTIGCEEDKSKSYFNGLIDELRIETTARSAAWVAAQARAASGQLTAVGSEEKRP